ncbi:MAG: hypothetical protein HY270_18030 [Deltaproteobacteria bacterium]|nr:hypothetical protein [Deltaproteobacteria bacterium]
MQRSEHLSRSAVLEARSDQRSIRPSLPALLDAVSRLKDAACRLRQRPVDDIIASLDRTIQRLLDPNDRLRRRAEVELPTATGFSAPMIRHGLPLLLAPLGGRQLASTLDAELGTRRVLDDAVGGGPRACGPRACGPDLIVHVLSGNIPALVAAPLLLSLAVKSPVVVKPAAGDPIFPGLLHEALAAVDPALADCVLVAPWRGGDKEIEEAIFGAAALVVASGSDPAIEAIRRRVAGRFIGHGHKISFAAIGRECLSDNAAANDLARRLAYDVSLWDQQGCLSPQLCYVENGGNVTADKFAELVAEALAVLAQELPPRRLSFEESAAVQRFRQAAEWNPANALLASAGTEWSVSIERGCELKPSALNRCLRLMVVDDLAELSDELPRHRHYLEAAGLAVGVERRREATSVFAASGVHHICPLGTMQTPTLAWRQSGSPRVGDWVEWTVIESTPA